MGKGEIPYELKVQGLDPDSCNPPTSVDAWESLKVQRQALHLTKDPPHTSLLWLVLPLLPPKALGRDRTTAFGTPVGKTVRESREWRENLPSTQGSSISVDIPGRHQTLVQFRLNTRKNAHKIKPNQTTPKRQQKNKTKIPNRFPKKVQKFKCTNGFIYEAGRG